jgi:hypothetical protein
MRTVNWVVDAAFELEIPASGDRLPVAASLAALVHKM